MPVYARIRRDLVQRPAHSRCSRRQRGLHEPHGRRAAIRRHSGGEALPALNNKIQPQMSLSEFLREVLRPMPSHDKCVTVGFCLVGTDFQIYEPRTCSTSGYQGTLGAVRDRPRRQGRIPRGVAGSPAMAFNVRRAGTATAVQFTARGSRWCSTHAMQCRPRPAASRCDGPLLASDLSHPDFVNGESFRASARRGCDISTGRFRPALERPGAWRSPLNRRPSPMDSEPPVAFHPSPKP